MRLSQLAFCLGLGVSALAFAHGGDGIDHSAAGAGAAQMPASLTESGGGSTAISGSINLSQPSIKSIGGGGGGGGSGEVALDAPAPTYPHLSQAGSVPNGTNRSVPGFDGGADTSTRLVLDRHAIVAPRTNESIQIYNRAYNADRELMNKWLKTLGF